LSAAGRLKDNSLIVRFGKKGLKKNQGTTYCFFISEAERLTGFLKASPYLLTDLALNPSYLPSTAAFLQEMLLFSLRQYL
jgi:hypothetical protein